MNLRPTSLPFLSFALVALALVVAVPSYIKPRVARARNACIDVNLPALVEAKKRWAEENGLGEKAVPKTRDLLPYLKGGRMPECPATGVYTIGAVGTSPSCSYTEHSVSFSNSWSRSRAAERK